MKEYYSPKDVMKIVECSNSLACQIIRELRKKFEADYPDSIPIKARIPIWYFKEKMGLEENENEEV